MNTAGARAPTGDALALLPTAKAAAPARDKTGGSASDSFADILSGLVSGPDANGGAPATEPASPPPLASLPFGLRRTPKERDPADAGAVNPAPQSDPSSTPQSLGTAYLAALLLPSPQPAGAPVASGRDVPATNPLAAQPLPPGATPAEIVQPPTPTGQAQLPPGGADPSPWRQNVAALGAVPTIAPTTVPDTVSVVRQETHFAPVLPTAPAAAPSQDAENVPLAAPIPLAKDVPSGRADGVAARRQSATPGAPASAPATGESESSSPVALPPPTGAAPDAMGGSLSGDPGTAAPDAKSADRSATDASPDADPVAGSGRDFAAGVATGLSPMGQIAGAITAAARSIGPSGAAATGAPAGAVTTMNRVLNIELEPAHLGTVAIRMRISGDRLEVQVEVARGGALDVLAKDQGSLAAALRASGYTVDALTITSANAGGAPSGGGHHGSHEPAQQPTPQFSGQSAQPGGSHDQRAGDDARGRSPPDDAGAARRGTDEAPRNASAPGHLRGDIYV